MVRKVATYLELPLLHPTPVLGNASDDAWTASLLVSFNEFFDSKIIDVDPLNSVFNFFRVVDLEGLILLTQITVLAPLTQTKAY